MVTTTPGDSVIDNTARECELTESLSAAIEANPQADAVLVRRHGIYGGVRPGSRRNSTEYFDYLFRFADRMALHGRPVVGAPSFERA